MFGGSAISWQLKTQSMVALSTLEAEYIATSEATREATVLRRLDVDLRSTLHVGGGLPRAQQVPIRVDNQGALKLINSGIIKSRTKHIDIKYHHAHDEQAKGTVVFEYVYTKENLADILTKGLPLDEHEYLVKAMHIMRAVRSKSDDHPDGTVERLISTEKKGVLAETEHNALEKRG